MQNVTKKYKPAHLHSNKVKKQQLCWDWKTVCGIQVSNREKYYKHFSTPKQVIRVYEVGPKNWECVEMETEAPKSKY